MDSWLKRLNGASDLSKKPIIIVGNKSGLEERKDKFQLKKERNSQKIMVIIFMNFLQKVDKA